MATRPGSERAFVLISVLHCSSPRCWASAAVGEISSDYIVTTFATLGTDQAVAVEELWRVPHPATERVLDAVSTHHPDRKVAKAARKALFKLRSRAR